MRVVEVTLTWSPLDGRWSGRDGDGEVRQAAGSLSRCSVLLFGWVPFLLPWRK